MKNILIKKIKNAEKKSGIYFFLNKEKKIIYIGKAKNLRNRLLNYVNNYKNNDIKTKIMVENAYHLIYVITKDEDEALITESFMIKKFTPKYNILLKDDKDYAYLIIDKNYIFPKIKKYRGKKTEKNFEYIGPFTTISKLKNILDIASKRFFIRDCSEAEFHKSRKNNQPCIKYQIKRCLAPCIDNISKRKYNNFIKKFLLHIDNSEN